MSPDDIEVDENGAVTLKGAYEWMGKTLPPRTPDTWMDEFGNWYAAVPSGTIHDEIAAATSDIRSAKADFYKLIPSEDIHVRPLYLHLVREDGASVWGEWE